MGARRPRIFYSRLVIDGIGIRSIKSYTSDIFPAKSVSDL